MACMVYYCLLYGFKWTSHPKSNPTRKKFECQYCGTNKDLTLDHILPKAKGGKSTWINLITACRRCNTRKGDYTPEEIGLSLKNSPYKPSYVLFLRDFSGYAHEEWIPYLKTGTNN